MPGTAQAEVQTTAVRIPAGGITLEGELARQDAASGLVILVHGSQRTRLSEANRAVARQIAESGFDTLDVDLLTASESQLDDMSSSYRYDVKLLSGRLRQVMDWARQHEPSASTHLGFFGDSTAAAAALTAAAASPDRVDAIVCRSGRPDLAWDALPRVDAPTLLIVGGRDTPCVQFNTVAAWRLHCPHETVLIPGSTHLLNEAGSVRQVAQLATGWYRRHLC